MKNWQNILEDYKFYLKLERNLSQNSIDAYLSDIQKLVDYLYINQLDFLPQDIKPQTLTEFIEHIANLGLNEKSQARIVSGIKSFFKYLIIEDLTKKDPSHLLETPKIGRKLPIVLSVEEIENILKNIDVSQALGDRKSVV